MQIPFEALSPETLRSLIEEFVTRDGTDYGEREISLDRRVEQVENLLRDGRVVIVFDAETESVDLREALGLPKIDTQHPAAPTPDTE